MNVISSFFLRAKHWQLFVLLSLCPVGQEAHFHFTRLNEIQKARILVGVVILLSVICFLLWLWSMGSFLSAIVPTLLKLRMAFFRFAVIYPALYFFPFTYVWFIRSPWRPMPTLMEPFHWVAAFCMLYNLYFVSKTLAMAETGKAVSFRDYVGPFFLIWFFPIGLWFIQPRINRIYAQRSAEHT